MIDALQAIVVEAGDVALRYFRQTEALDFESKGPLDLVTEADRAVEKLVFDRLRAVFPDDGIVGEEGATAPSRSGRVWVVDPIDGTFNFVRGTDQWSVSIGLFDGHRAALGAVNLPAQGKIIVGGVGVAPTVNGERLKPPPRFDPKRAVVALGLGMPRADDRWAELVRDVSAAGLLFRYCGCGSASLIDVALGEVDGYVSLAETSWDVMAGLAILEALGVRHTADWASVGLREKFPLVCGNADLIERLSPFVLGPFR